MSCFVFTTSILRIFHCRVYGVTAPAHCCEMSRHISHAWQGNSPPLSTRGAELSLVSATVVVGVDRSRDRQTYVPPKIQEWGGPACFQRAIISAAYRHPLLLFEEGLFRGLLQVPAQTVTFRQLKTSFSGVCARLHRTQTHIFAHATHRKKQKNMS